MNESRHERLTSAGWRYDAAQDRYAAPGSPTDGTERWYNQAAAWGALEAAQAAETTTPGTPVRTRQRDPRQQEPQ